MTFAEAAMIMMSGGSGNIQPLSVTANGPYEAPVGVDGYNPVNVNVPSEAITEGLSVTSNGTYTPSVGVDGFNLVEVSVDDRYDDGYADGEAAVRAKIQSKEIDTNGTYYAARDGLDGFDPVKVNVPDRYDEGYQDGYNDGYNDGYSLAESFFNNTVDNNKQYTLVFYLGDELKPNLRWIMCSVHNTTDMSEIRHFNWWPTNMELCYNARFTKIWWQRDDLRRYINPQVEIEGTAADGTNRNRYTRPFTRGELYPFTYNPSNTNIISRIPT